MQGILRAGPVLIGILSVSYTHLDVYKRQVLFCSFVGFLLLSECFDLGAPIRGRLRKDRYLSFQEKACLRISLRDNPFQCFRLF